MIAYFRGLIPPLYRKANMIAFTDAFIFQADDFTESAKDVISGWLLESAIGKQLDAIALEAGIYRGGLTDTKLRNAIKAAFIANNSHGTRTEIELMLRLLFGTPDAQIYQNFPAGISIQVQGIAIDPELIDIAKVLLRRAVGAGVGLGGLWTQDDAYFSWLGDTNPLAGGWDAPWMRYTIL